MTIRNVGDEVAEGVNAGTSFVVTRGFRTARLFTIPESAPCRLAFTDFVPPPPRPAIFGVTIFPDPGSQDLVPGDSVSCIFSFEVAREAPPRFEFPVTAFAQNTDPDANRDNNQAILVIEKVAVPVPAASMLALALLTIFVLVGAYLRPWRSAST